MKSLLIWECGQDLGHISHLSVVAKVLHDMGSEIFLCVKESKNIPVLFKGVPHRVLPFPKNSFASQKRPTASMADVLVKLGFDDVAYLAKQCRKWKSVFDSISPDMVVFDFAPTAMLASKGYNFKKVAVDSTWGLPPPKQPFLPLDIWSELPVHWIETSEQTVLQTMNTVMESFSLKALDFASDIFEVDLTLIANFPEFDIYAHLRNSANYLGPLYENTAGQYLILSASTRKVFGYLKEGRRQTKSAIDALIQLQDADVHLFIPNVSHALRQFLNRHKIKVYAEPVALHRQLSKFDLVICHGGSGTISSSVKAGVPVMILATQLEQRNVAELVTRSGAGLHAEGDDKIDLVLAKFEALLTGHFYKDNCKNISRTVTKANSVNTKVRHLILSLLQ